MRTVRMLIEVEVGIVVVAQRQAEAADDTCNEEEVGGVSATI